MPKDIPTYFHSYRPDPEDVENLISAAQEHTLGIDFLLKGDLGSVAAIFRTHAFAVEAARTYWLENNKGAVHVISETDHRL
jgi:hypothetical protein